MAEIKILHVDDNPRIIQVTQLYFKHFGSNFKLTPAFSAAQGLELLERESFDVIIADYKMPEMNGIEFLEEVRRRGDDTPFIILTGKGDEAVAMKALNKGANRYLKKEGSPSVLFNTLRQYIEELVEERKREKEKSKLMSRLIEEYLTLLTLGILADTGEHRAMREKDLMERICRRSCIPLSLQNLRFHLNSLEREGVIASVRQPSSGERFFFIKPAEAVEKKDKGIFLTKIYDREKRIQELEELIWSSRP